MKKSLGNIFLALSLVCVSQVIVAAKNPIFDSEEDGDSLSDLDNPFIEGEPWKEIGIKLPPFPRDSDLIDLHIDSPGNRFSYFVDEKSLDVSEKDYVIRYTMVIESKRKTRNIFYEGIRCATMEYKTYAFGSGKRKTLQASKKPKWKSISQSGYKRLRTDLMEQFFCEWKLPRKRIDIVNRIKYSSPSEPLDD